MTSTDKYHRRWSSAGATVRGNHSGTTSKTVTSLVEPRTYGTSWDSVRWNKPLGSSGGGGHWSRYMSAFEPKTNGTHSTFTRSSVGRYSSKNITARNVDSRNPGLLSTSSQRTPNAAESARSFLKEVIPTKLSLNTETPTGRRSAMFNTYTRTAKPSYERYTAKTTTTTTNSYTPNNSSASRPYSSNYNQSALTTASTSRNDRTYYNPLQIANSKTLRTERPWRQRMSDAARLRDTHGDEVGNSITSTLAATRARRNSLSSQQQSGDELRSSLNALKKYVDGEKVTSYRRGSRFTSNESPLYVAGHSSHESSIVSSNRYVPRSGIYNISRRQPSRENTFTSREPLHGTYLSRSYSPIRSRLNTKMDILSKYASISSEVLPQSWQRSSWLTNKNSIYDNIKSHISEQSINSPIPEVREIRRRRLPSKERSLRYHKIVAKDGSDSSSGTEERAESRERRLRKRFRKKFTDNKVMNNEKVNGIDEVDQTRKSNSYQKQKDLKDGTMNDSCDPSSKPLIAAADKGKDVINIPVIYIDGNPSVAEKKELTKIEDKQNEMGNVKSLLKKDDESEKEGMKKKNIFAAPTKLKGEKDEITKRILKFENIKKMEENDSKVKNDKEIECPSSEQLSAAIKRNSIMESSEERNEKPENVKIERENCFELTPGEKSPSICPESASEMDHNFPAADLGNKSKTCTKFTANSEPTVKTDLSTNVQKCTILAEQKGDLESCTVLNPVSNEDVLNIKSVLDIDTLETIKVASNELASNESMDITEMLHIDVELAEGIQAINNNNDNRSELCEHHFSPRISLPPTVSATHAGKSVEIELKASNIMESVKGQKQSKSKSPSRSPAPVPGTWTVPEYHEMNISQIRHLERRHSLCAAKTDVVIEEKCTSCPVSPVFKIYAVTEKPKNVYFHGALKSVIVANEAIELTKYFARYLSVDKDVKEPTIVLTNTILSFSKRMKRNKLASASIKQKNFKSESCSLSVKAVTSVTIALRQEIIRKREGTSCRALVNVLTSPIIGVNYYRCKRRLRGTHSNRPPPPSVIIESKSKENESRAGSVVQMEMMATVVNSDQMLNNDLKPVKLVLSNHSLLEDDVNEKKDKFYAIADNRADISEVLDKSKSPSVERMRACAIRVLEPAREFPYITAPSRSRLGSVDVETSTVMPNTGHQELIDNLPVGEQMLSASFHGLKSSPINRAQRSVSLSKSSLNIETPSFDFEAPLSPFEQRLQNQAFRLRRISAASTLSTYSDGDAPILQETPLVDVTMQPLFRDSSHRLSSEGAPSITTTFTAAAAAAAQPRHERYAAHIPLNRGDISGRQSDASVDSANSGALETASRQLDQMIDQARYRHHQHRSKFKEAIDYLDQIFEDLKKEGELTSEEVPCNYAKSVQNTKRALKAAQHSPLELPVPLPSSSGTRGSSDLTTVSRTVPSFLISDNQEQHRVPRLPKPEDVKKIDNNENFEQIGDVDVSETILLPTSKRNMKGERFDFTRKWLTDDLKSWTTSPSSRPDLLLDGLEEEDGDDRSLGSCSAEVAAINSVDRQRKKTNDMPDLIQNAICAPKFVRRVNKQKHEKGSVEYYHHHQQQQHHYHNYHRNHGPIKPHPVKAQPIPIYTFSSGSVDTLVSTNNRPSQEEIPWKISHRELSTKEFPVQRVSSNNWSQDRDRSADTPSWRSTSQELSTAVSSNNRAIDQLLSGVVRKTGAFTPVQPPSIIALRGSVSSLPETAVIGTQHILNTNTDPTLSVDALVAELELNTDRITIADKRRSFPIGVEYSVTRNGDCMQPRSSCHNTENTNDNMPTRTRSERITRNQNVEKVKSSFEEMASMLDTVAREIPSSLSQKSIKGKTTTAVLSPFETINQEKGLYPSKVEALQSMFENKKGKQPGVPKWRRSLQNTASNNKDEDNYYEIGELTKKETSPAQKPPVRPGNSYLRKQPQHDSVPAFPLTQPPSQPPGSTNSSQTGGYYSSGSSLGAPPSYGSQNHSSLPRSSGRRGSLVGKQSASSRAASFEDEDDGFYDNLPVDESRRSRGSELDNLSVSSHRMLPTDKSNSGKRLGQFLRRISASKPPANAASLVSLNKVASEITAGGPVPLMKSNSLSHDPWNKNVVRREERNQQNTAAAAAVEKRGGIGQRLKNTIFGSKRRLK